MTTTLTTIFVDDPQVTTEVPVIDVTPEDVDTTDPPNWDPPPVTENVRCVDDLSPLACVVVVTDPTQPPTTRPPTVVTVTYPTVYASDLASFRPSAPTFAAEPNGAGLLGKPVNFVASASEHVLSGSVLGFPVSVRFSPTSYTFDYGDGTTLTSAGGGATWTSTGSAQFSETSTSHAYVARGTYATSSSVAYAAWVNFGDGAWRPVIGQVTAGGPTVSVRIYEPKTALVRDSCTTAPDSPGC